MSNNPLLELRPVFYEKVHIIEMIKCFVEGIVDGEAFCSHQNFTTLQNYVLKIENVLSYECIDCFS